MKAKALNFLFVVKRVFLYTLIFGILFEILVLTIPIRIIVNLPNAFDIYNYVLAIISTLLLLSMIFFSKDKREKSSFKVKESKRPKMGKVIMFRGLEFPLRFLLFLIIGFLAGVYIILSFIFFEKIAEINQGVRMILLFFGIFYPLASFLILLVKEYAIMNVFNLIQKVLGIKVEKKNNEIEEVHNGVKGGVATAFDVFMYYIGGFIGWCLCLLIMFIILVPIGIIWLIQNPNPLGILTISILLLAFLTFLAYRKWRDFNDFLDNLSFFPDFKI